MGIISASIGLGATSGIVAGYHLEGCDVSVLRTYAKGGAGCGAIIGTACTFAINMLPDEMVVMGGKGNDTEDG